MSNQSQQLPTHQQLVDSIVTLNSKLDEQGVVIQNQGETIASLREKLEQANFSNIDSDKSVKNDITSRTERLPPLDKFRGNRNMWDEWHLGAIHKLTKDGPAIGDGLDQFMYVYSKLDGDAVKMVSTTARTLSESKSGNGLEFLDYLNTVFGDPNKKSRAQQQLYNLKQKDKESFAVFLPRFETILATAGWSVYADDQKISLLKNALSKEMRTALVGKKLPSAWGGCISELLTISSEIIAINQQFKPQFWGSSSIITKPSDSSTNMDWEPVQSTVTGTNEGMRKRATWVKKDVLIFRKKKGLCVRCGNKGHIAPNCSFLPPINPNVNLNVSQLSLEDEEEVEVMKLAHAEKTEDIQGKDELL